jgi:hypothetical protein
MGDSQLDNFRRELNSSLAYGALADMDLPVTSDDGGCPVVVALEDERVSVVLGRLRAVGGFANLFVRGGGRRLRVASVINSSCAIPIPDDDMTGDEGPGPTATVGTFLDYVERRPNGVMLSAALGHPAWARDAHTVEFAGSAL